MEIGRTPRARIVAAIPVERVDLTLGDGASLPKIGDIVELDQGFTMSSGERAGIVVCCNSDGTVRWVADVLECEMEIMS
jgi:hypothetical protein